MKCPLTRLSSLPVILSEVSQVLSHLRISYQIFMRNILFLRVIKKGGVKRDRRGFDVTFMTYERLVIKAMDWITILLDTVGVWNKSRHKQNRREKNPIKQTKQSLPFLVFLNAIQIKISLCSEIYSQLYTLFMYLWNTNNFNNKKRDKFNTSIIKTFHSEIKIFNLFGVHYSKNTFWFICHLIEWSNAMIIVKITREVVSNFILNKVQINIIIGTNWRPQCDNQTKSPI